MKTTALLIAGLGVSLGVRAAEPLNIKTGQWEITFSTQTSGRPPISDDVLARMPPGQRAQLLAALGKTDAEPEQHKSVECVTQEDLEKPFKTPEESNCETTVIKGTSTVQDIAVSCKGEHPASGKMHIEASSTQSMKGLVEVTLAGGKDAMKIKTQMSGRWVGPACAKEDE